MIDLLLPLEDQLVAETAPGIPKPTLTAAQTALRERKVLAMNSLTHGAYYNGLLDDLTTVGRWNGEKRRFVFREHAMGQPGFKGVPHVADLGMGARFAPLSVFEADGGFPISDFAFEATR